MMPFSRKFSLAVMMCLSIAMIICALARLVGTIVDTRPDGSGAAPVWSTYWAIVESCVSVIMTTVIVIRSMVITRLIRDDRQKQESIIERFGRRLLSTLRLPGSSRSSRRSPPWPSENRQDLNPGTPRISTQGMTRATLSNVKRFISSENVENGSGHDVLQSVDTDTDFVLRDMDYHSVQRAEVRKPEPRDR